MEEEAAQQKRRHRAQARPEVDGHEGKGKAFPRPQGVPKEEGPAHGQERAGHEDERAARVHEQKGGAPRVGVAADPGKEAFLFCGWSVRG